MESTLKVDYHFIGANVIGGCLLMLNNYKTFFTNWTLFPFHTGGNLKKIMSIIMSKISKKVPEMEQSLKDLRLKINLCSRDSSFVQPYYWLVRYCLKVKNILNLIFNFIKISPMVLTAWCWNLYSDQKEGLTLEKKTIPLYDK